MKSLIAAEFLKLRTTRTVWGLLSATVVVSALAVAGAILAAQSSGVDLQADKTVQSVLAPASNGAVFVLVLGIIMSAGEYRQGTAVDTFLTSPRRWRVISSKLVVASTVGVVFGALAVGVSLLVAGQMYRANGTVLPLESSDVWLILAGAVLFSVLFAGLGAATGSLVRNQVAAIVGWLTWLAIVEHIVVGLIPDVGRWLPAAAGQALMRAPNEDLLTQRSAALLLVVYGLVIMSAAVFTERYRDA